MRLGGTLRDHGALRRRGLPAPGREAHGHAFAAGADDVRAHAEAAATTCARSTTCPALKCAIHAAAPCPVPIKEQMIDWWGPIIDEYYAGTEGNGMTMVQLGRTGSRTRARSAAPWSASCTIATTTATSCRSANPARSISPTARAVRIPQRRRRRPPSRATTKGWTTLGDVGYVDADGYPVPDRPQGLHDHLGRREHLPAGSREPADHAPEGHRRAPCSACRTRSSARRSRRSCSRWTWRDAGPELADELIAFCREHLSHVKCPRSIDFDAELPRHPTGKLYKRLLRDQYWAGRQSKLV